jgi:PadR family transcriptional regulator, regulatory protein PadR
MIWVMANMLGKFEEHCLLALIRTGPNSTAADVFRVLADRLDREPSFGAVFTTLDRLATKKFVFSKIDEEPVSGQKRRRFFSISGEGKRALSDSLNEFDRAKSGLALPFPMT